MNSIIQRNLRKQAHDMAVLADRQAEEARQEDADRTWFGIAYSDGQMIGTHYYKTRSEAIGSARDEGVSLIIKCAFQLNSHLPTYTIVGDLTGEDDITGEHTS